MEDEIRKFLGQHQMLGKSDMYNYHIALGLYYAYSIDAYVLAEKIENGEIFDEYEAGVIMQYAYIAKKTLNYYQNILKFPVDQFNTAEKVCFMHGCILEKGGISGNVEAAITLAKTWVKKIRDSFSSEMVIKEKDMFLYEVAIYILYITGNEVDYSFLKYS